jgi:chondroitin AC lyase
MCLKKLLLYLEILCAYTTTASYAQTSVVAAFPISGNPAMLNNADIESIKVLNHSDVRRDSNRKIDDISILIKRIVLDVRKDGVPLLSPFNEETTVNGSWNDINYSDNNPANWQPSIHWDRILSLAIKFSETGNLRIKNNIVRAIKFWDERKPVADNYWWNAIGVPLKIGKTLVLMGNQLPVELQHAALKYMELGIKKDFYDYHGKATGQNLVWLATVHLMMGVMQKDTAALARAFNAIYTEVKVSAEEGIQYDFSFHQHGTILYSGGYGLGFTTEICKLVNWSHGTVYQFPVERINIICSYILDGQQWMVRNQTIDYSSTGREISRFGNYYARAKSILQSCKLLIELNVPREHELQVLADRLEGASLTTLSGNRHFWRSDFLVHHRPKFYSSVKMSSSRTKGSESGNNENLQGYYLGQGIQVIMRSGKEYEEIFPVWDWQKLPGLLSEQKTDKLPPILWGAGAEGKKSFAGGVSDGQYGLAAYDYVRDNVSAKRSWFYFDDEIVCLGAAIGCATDNSLFQTINQSLLKGDVLVGSERTKIETLKRGVHALKKQQWIYHDSTAYFPEDGAMFSVKNDAQTGNWRTINNNHSAPDLTITKNVFTAWIDLGKQVKNKTYAYTIVPGISVSDVAHYNHPVMILVNNSTTQAVWHQKLNIVEAAFYQPGEIKAGNYVISVDKPVLLLARDNEHELTISLANPENKYLNVVVTVNHNVQCDNCSWSAEKKQSSFSMELPAGNEAGKSVSKRLIKKE